MRRVQGAARVILIGLTIGTVAALAIGCAARRGADGERTIVTLTRSASSRSTAHSGSGPAAPIIFLDARPSVVYLARLSDAVEHTRGQLSHITASAEVAANRVVRGARLLVGGTQGDFLAEMIDRAGGLAMAAPLPKVLNRGDIVLYAVPSRLTVADRSRIAQWRSQGVYVIGFASAALSNDPYFQPDLLIDSGDAEGVPLGDGKIAPTDTVMNLVNAWTWTGEFVAACTRLGRMPVVKQSLGETGARDRAERYRGRRFHDDLRVAAVPPGALGGAYLDCVAASLTGLTQQAPPTLEFGGRWLRDAGQESRGLYVASPLFPAHFADARAPQLFGTRDELQLRQPPQTPLSVVIGYQDPPQIAIDFATMRRGRLIYTSARRDGADNRHEVLYVDPHATRGDACVGIAGYDIDILPSSSIMQAAVYWSLIAEANGIRPARNK